jgi:hypothetical protein
MRCHRRCRRGGGRSPIKGTRGNLESEHWETSLYSGKQGAVHDAVDDGRVVFEVLVHVLDRAHNLAFDAIDLGVIQQLLVDREGGLEPAVKHRLVVTNNTSQLSTRILPIVELKVTLTAGIANTLRSHPTVSRHV